MDISARTGGAPQDPAVMTIPRAAHILGISIDLAYDLARRGTLPGAFQFGRCWRVSAVKLCAFLEETECAGAR